MQITSLFKDLLKLIIQNEKNLDQMRQQLVQNSLFSLKPIFNRLDQARQGFIDTVDFISFCEDHVIQINSKEAYYTLKWLDRDWDGKVTFEDLCKSILPKDNYKQRIVTALREPYQIEKNMYLPMQIENPLAEYISQLVDSVRKQQELKFSIFQNKESNVYQIYSLIDPLNKGITSENIEQFLNISSEDIDYFFWVADYDQDGYISCQEFIELIMNVDYSQNIQPVTFQKINQTNQQTKKYADFQPKKQYHEYSAQIQNQNRSITPKKQKAKYQEVYEEYQKKQEWKSVTPLRYQRSEINLPQSQIAQTSNISNDNDKTVQKLKYKNLQNDQPVQQKTPEKEKNNNKYILIQDTMQSPEPQIQNQKKTYNDIKNNHTQAKTVKKMAQPYDLVPQNKNKNFFKFLLKQILLLRELEEAKRQVALRKDFTILEAFRILDVNSLGQLNQAQFLKSLEILNVKPPLKVVQLVFSQYCQNQNTMRYADFHQMVISQTPDYSILLEGRNQQEFSSLTLKLFIQLLDIILRNETIIQQYKETIQSNSAELFKMLNRENKPCLNENDIREFLREYDVYPTAIELKRLIRRYSTKSEINYEEFQRQLQID